MYKTKINALKKIVSSMKTFLLFQGWDDDVNHYKCCLENKVERLEEAQKYMEEKAKEINNE